VSPSCFRDFVAKTQRRFVVISGLPGSGKTTIGRALGPLLRLTLIDKDDILEHLYETCGVGDTGWRRTLSRDADLILRRDATALDGAVLVSLWRVPGMSEDSGTPIDWIPALSDHIVHLRCVCDPGIAARRFTSRTRHPGHLDASRSLDEIAASIRALATLPPPEIRTRIDVDTSAAYDVAKVVQRISDTWPAQNATG